MKDPIQMLFDNNRDWADSIRDEDPDFFRKLSHQQNPNYLWIGCSDSRVPANQIIGLMPGEIFVHRNIANVMVHTDLNCLSVLQYAVEILKVEHIIVCGHYDCGGIQAAMDGQEHGLIDNWLRHIKDVYRMYKTEIDLCPDARAKLDRLCEYNIIEQVNNICQTTILQNAWRSGQRTAVHGWVYRLSDGILKDLEVTVDSHKNPE